MLIPPTVTTGSNPCPPMSNVGPGEGGDVHRGDEREGIIFAGVGDGAVVSAGVGAGVSAGVRSDGVSASAGAV